MQLDTRYGDYLNSLNVSRETLCRIQTFVEYLLDQNKFINLVSRQESKDFYSRHVVDSLQILRFLPSRPASLLDIGSGGGFPGVPLAIVGVFKSVTLVESVHKKAAFLKQCSDKFNLKMAVHCGRAENLHMSPKPDVITARAVAALSKLLCFIIPHCSSETILLLHKGKSHLVELNEAKKSFRFDCEIHPSVTDSHGVILSIKNLRSKTKL